MHRLPANDRRISLSLSTVSLFRSMALVAGFINETGFIDFADARLGWKKRAHNISHGEGLALLLLSLANGSF